ncbi:MAG: nitrilase-related carbon-nitrogen hydrolase [Chloroflexota bacterium]|nr:nitrilase-related carbon-nitrogen hydrolase [Chloroflexota bacterium]
MKIAIAQMKCYTGDVALNCAHVSDLVQHAHRLGCEAIVFPEMTDTGYDMNSIKETASPWTGLPFATARRAAKDCKMHVICGLSEREYESIYNSLAIFNPEGELIGKYRKTHLFSPDPVNENRYIVAGNSLEVVPIGDMKWGFMICYDLRFPEVSRQLLRRGAEVLVVCSAWPCSRESHWKTLTAARAIENQACVIAANRVGSDGPLTFCGSSCIIGPDGTPVIAGSSEKEELVIGEIDREAIINYRNITPFLKDRWDDLYKQWECA